MSFDNSSQQLPTVANFALRYFVPYDRSFEKMSALKNLFAPKADAINSVASISARIETEQQSLAAEESNEAALTAERQRLMQDVDTSDADIDDVERRMGDCRSAQLRKIERITLLQERLQIATAKDQQAALDAQQETAGRIRDRGIALISRYAKLAPALASIIDELHTTSAALEGINHTLSRAGRAPIADANAVRCTPGKQAEIEERVTVMPGDPKHPAFGTTRMVDNDRRHAPHLVSTIDGSIIGPAEITATRIQHVAGDHQPPLQHAVNLPSAEAASPPYWQAKHPNEHRRADQAKVDALLKELGLPSPSKAA
jgi:hypothetical protein